MDLKRLICDLYEYIPMYFSYSYNVKSLDIVFMLKIELYFIDGQWLSTMTKKDR